jgi:hypothetical protein
MGNECKANQYKTNEVVTHGHLICFGGFRQPRCKFLKVCIEENGMTRTKIYRELVKEAGLKIAKKILQWRANEKNINY